MSLLAHLIRADVRRSWPLLCAWLGMAIVSAVIPCVVPVLARGDIGVLAALDLPIGLLAVAYPLVLLLFVVQVVQTHPLVGTNAFWTTRPIPPRTLLASKATVLGVAAVVIPMAIEVVRMVAHDVPWSAQGGVAVDTALTHTFLLALLMLGAAVTANLSRFLLLVGSALASLAVAISILVVMGSRNERPPSYEGWSALPDPTPWLVQIGLLIVAAAGALLMQYVTRSRARTGAVAAAGIAVTVSLNMTWQWPLLRPTDDPPDWSRADTALNLRVGGPSTMESFPFGGANGGQWFGVRAPLGLDGVEPGYVARVGIIEASLRVGDATLTSYRDLSPARIQIAGETLPPELAAPRDILGVDRLAVRPWQQFEKPILFFAAAADIQKHAPGAGDYHGRLRVVLQRYQIETVMPLLVGTVHHRGSYRVTVDSVGARWGTVDVQVHESRADSTLDLAPYSSYAYYLRNASRREAVPASPHALGEATNAFRFLSISLSADRQSGFTAKQLLLRFVVPDDVEGRSEILGEAWMAGAELVIVSMRRAGSVERDLEIADFPLSLPSRASLAP